LQPLAAADPVCSRALPSLSPLGKNKGRHSRRVLQLIRAQQHQSRHQTEVPQYLHPWVLVKYLSMAQCFLAVWKSSWGRPRCKEALSVVLRLWAAVCNSPVHIMFLEATWCRGFK